MKRLLSSLLMLLILSECHMDIPLAPSATFSFTGGNCNAPCAVTFNTNAQNASSFIWDFDDGQTASGATVNHTYTSAKTYSVRMTVKGEGGSYGTTQQVTIYPAIPSKVWDKTFGGTTRSGSSLGSGLNAILPTPDGGFLLGGGSGMGKGNDKSEDNKGSFNYDYWVMKIDANGTKIWDRVFGGTDDESIVSMVATSDGGYLLGGTSTSDRGEDKSENSRGVKDLTKSFFSADYWVVKIDANGNKNWDKTFGGTAQDNLISVVATSDGGFLLAGTSDSEKGADKSESKKGNSDYWVVKIDASGIKLWDKTVGGNSRDVLSSAVSISDGSFLLAGESSSDMGSDKTENKKGGTNDSDYWVVKLSATGTKLWDKTLGGTDSEGSPTAIATSDGGGLIAGYSLSKKGGDKSENNKSEFGINYWLVRLNAAGAKLWDKTLGGNSLGSSTFDFPSSVTKTADGSFIIAGKSTSGRGGDKSEETRGKEDYWAVKVDANGTKLWDKTVGGTDDDVLNSVVVTSDGGYLLGGNSISSKTADKSENLKGYPSWWVVKIK